MSQLQDVVNSGQYQGIILQPIFGAALLPEVKIAIKKKIKVVNIDQILGTKYTTDQIQVTGLYGQRGLLPVARSAPSWPPWPTRRAPGRTPARSA